ncbi:MAG: SRPBCC domain-containing protein [Burkholderiales bacterium]|nr:SRPBCC domain-containing protein [Burkholderiales bacterium]
MPPVDHTVNVPLPPADAFALFTQEMPKWWPLSTHSCGGDDANGVTFEPRVGGRVMEQTRTGRQHPWGTLLEWDPPRVLAMRWHPGQPEEQATLLRVTFTARDRSTDVRIVHEGWEVRGESAAAVRQEYEKGWPLVMGQFAGVAAG